MHYSLDSIGDSCERVMVPCGRRNNVLEFDSECEEVPVGPDTM